MSKILQYDAITGIFRLDRTMDIYAFRQNATSVKMERLDDFDPRENYSNEKVPLPLLRHSFGVSEGEVEDYSKLHNYSDMNDREREIAVCLNSDGSIQNLEYRGIKLPIGKESYSHVVGPIHAGIIEPGHFRFYVTGEVIQKLHIRLGYQKRGVYSLLKNKKPMQAIPIVEAVATDSCASYSTALSEIYEKAFDIKVTDETKLWRIVFRELERIAIHIGDMGAVAGDIGFYPLLGLCSTDRGVPLGILETLTGSRFAKGCIYPGEVKLNRKLEKSDLPLLSDNLKKAEKRLESQILRALHSTTFKERLQSCGTISRHQVYKNSFVGMAARCTGVVQDLRLSENIYNQVGMTLWLEDYREELMGDAWSRFFLRYIEFKNSCEFLINILPKLDISSGTRGRPLCMKYTECEPGLYYSSVEGWRGPVLIALDLNQDTSIRQAYIRDPSVLNWHALELAVRKELIGDFPLNNKSFNLSYVGVDL
ncbi:MAG: metal (Ni/Fe) hydrogenase large subunit [Leptospiraceae bacterium]|nr:metal (Ni/Fe) hydrogenase large subunit [Leptospiraceae bacterium]MCP5502360.1 metal (Ni/Fe) hydrogenase large subunit [Leptospiraceae bacterium]